MNIAPKSLIWVIDGDLSQQLHKTARLNPAYSLCKLGWNISMVTSGIPYVKANKRLKFIKMSWPKIYPLGGIVYYLSILWALISEKIEGDVLLFQSTSAPFLLLMTFFRYFKRKTTPRIVLDTRSVQMDTGTTRGKLRTLWYKLGLLMAAHLADGQTVITKEMAKAISVSEKQLLGIWPSGVNVEDFKISLFDRRWPNVSEPVRLIYIGVLRSERNQLGMLEAVRLARKRGLNVELEVVGSGMFREELEKFVQLKCKDGIRIKPPVPAEEIPHVLAKAHVGILPFPDTTKMRVSSFIKLFEYMAAGMPIVATRIIPHIDVLDGVDFVFWSKNSSPKSICDAIQEVCMNKMRFPELGSKAHASSQNWTWDASAGKLSEALTKALKGT